MSVMLNVPMVYQDTTMSCWYASACMVAYYHEAGPRLGLPQNYMNNTGITAQEFIKLAKVEGFSGVYPLASTITAIQLETYLRRRGPLWAAGMWNGFPHIIVITGVKTDTVYINDPDPSYGRATRTLDWFNRKLCKNLPNCLMYKG